MRIAFFVQYAHAAGTYFRWHNLAIALKHHGHVVHVYASDLDTKASKRIEHRDGIKYYINIALITQRIFGLTTDPLSAIKRRFTKVDEQYDVYHLFQPFLDAFLIWNKLRKGNKKSIFFYDWDDLWIDGLLAKPKTIREKYVYAIVNYLEKRVPQLADKTTVCSRFLGNRINNATLIYNGFWPQADLESKAILRQKWKLELDIFYWAYIGKTAAELDWINQALMLMQQIDLLKQKVKLLVVGPPASSIEELGWFKNEFVQYMGEVSAKEAKELAKASDLGLIPLEENNFNKSRFPIKFFDFLSVGTPIYYSSVGEIAQIGATIEGAIVGSAEKEKWAQGLVETTKKLLIQYPKVNIKIIEASYTWIAIAAELKKSYISISGSK